MDAMFTPCVEGQCTEDGAKAIGEVGARLKPEFETTRELKANCGSIWGLILLKGFGRNVSDPNSVLKMVRNVGKVGVNLTNVKT